MTNDEKDEIKRAAAAFYEEDGWVSFNIREEVEEDFGGHGYWVKAHVWLSKELV
jgi:hypothetical protein